MTYQITFSLPGLTAQLLNSCWGNLHKGDCKCLIRTHAAQSTTKPLPEHQEKKIVVIKIVALMILDYGLHSLAAFANTKLLFHKKKEKGKFPLLIQNNTNRCIVALLTQSSRKLTLAAKVHADPSSVLHPNDK